jgi:hypothetical protein
VGGRVDFDAEGPGQEPDPQIAYGRAPFGTAVSARSTSSSRGRVTGTPTAILDARQGVPVLSATASPHSRATART